jgi:carbonic anhydrase
MLTVNTNNQFTNPSLIKFNSNSVNFDDRNVLDRPELRAQNTPDSVLDRLVIGNQQFVEIRANQIQRNDSICLSGIAKGNTPFAAILNYAKLETSIEDVFDRKFGELFTIESPGKNTTQQEISAIEYSVLMLGIKVVIVLGDASKQTDDPKSEGLRSQPRQHLKVEIEKKKILISGSTGTTADLQQPSPNIGDSLNKLTASKLLCQFINAGSLKIIGGFYDIDSGRVTIDS